GRDQHDRHDHGARDETAQRRPAPGSHEADERGTGQQGTRDDEQSTDDGRDGDDVERGPRERARARRQRRGEVLRRLREPGAADHEDRPRDQHEQRTAPPTRLLGHAGAEEEQRTGPLDEAVPGERRALAKPRSVPACVVLDQRAQLVAVPGAPRGRVPPERIAPRAGHDAAPSARRRAAPTRDSVRISSTTADSASDPAAVIRYGRRRSSAGSGSMRPRSSSRVIAPYSAPGPSDTPANASMSLASA